MQALPIVIDCGCGSASGGGSIPGPPGPRGPQGPPGPAGISGIVYVDPVDDPPDPTVAQSVVNVVCRTFWYWTPSVSPPPAGSWSSFSLDGLQTVPTIVELRQVGTVACDPPPMVFTQGNLVVGDDQPAPYRWDPDSLDADDAISTIKPDDRDDATPGRWKQVIFA